MPRSITCAPPPKLSRRGFEQVSAQVKPQRPARSNASARASTKAIQAGAVPGRGGDLDRDSGQLGRDLADASLDALDLA